MGLFDIIINNNLSTHISMVHSLWWRLLPTVKKNYINSNILLILASLWERLHWFYNTGSELVIGSFLKIYLGKTVHAYAYLSFFPLY